MLHGKVGKGGRIFWKKVKKTKTTPRHSVINGQQNSDPRNWSCSADPHGWLHYWTRTWLAFLQGILPSPTASSTTARNEKKNEGWAGAKDWNEIQPHSMLWNSAGLLANKGRLWSWALGVCFLGGTTLTGHDEPLLDTGFPFKIFPLFFRPESLLEQVLLCAIGKGVHAEMRNEMFKGRQEICHWYFLESRVSS